MGEFLSDAQKVEIRFIRVYMLVINRLKFLKGDYSIRVFNVVHI